MIKQKKELEHGKRYYSLVIRGSSSWNYPTKVTGSYLSLESRCVITQQIGVS